MDDLQGLLRDECFGLLSCKIQKIILHFDTTRTTRTKREVSEYLMLSIYHLETHVTYNGLGCGTSSNNLII